MRKGVKGEMNIEKWTRTQPEIDKTHRKMYETKPDDNTRQFTPRAKNETRYDVYPPGQLLESSSVLMWSFQKV